MPRDKGNTNLERPVSPGAPNGDAKTSATAGQQLPVAGKGRGSDPSSHRFDNQVKGANGAVSHPQFLTAEQQSLGAPKKSSVVQSWLQQVNKEKNQSVKDVYVFSNFKRMQLAKDGPEKDKYGFDWTEMLSDPDFTTPSVDSFRHVPMSSMWTKYVSIGMKLEVVNTDVRKGDPQCYWIASIVRLIGYKALLRYEGFDEDNSKDFWVNIGAEDVHPVGWVASNKKPLIPPLTIQRKFTGWPNFIMERLTGRLSLPAQFHSRVLEASRSRFQVGMTLELVDRYNPCTIKVATVEMISGRRLKLRYADAPVNDATSIVHCHEESTLIHPVGWALSVGHMIDADEAYMDRCSKREFLESDATKELFNKMKSAAGKQAGLKFTVGMKLEAVDPLKLNQICVATVAKVLLNDYILVRIDRKPDEYSTTFCCHATSACIAPPGFCETNGVILRPPVDYEGERFLWYDYLQQQKVVAAPEVLFQSPMYSTVQKLSPGMRVEAVDLVDPRLVCVATVAQVAGRLVRIHFDGWSDEFEQWMDAASPELYPVGWCELVGHRLEPPNTAACSPTKSMKKKTKSGGGRRQKLASNPSKKEKRESSKRPKASRSAAPTCPSTSLSLRSKGSSESQETSDEVDDGGEKDVNCNKMDISAAGGRVKKIPKLIDLGKDQQKEALAGVEIKDWSPTDVAEFLRVNGLAAHSDAFIKEMVDGSMLSSMTEDRALQLTGVQVESSLMLLNLIRQLGLVEIPNTNGSARSALLP